MNIIIEYCDIVDKDIDAIVNSANPYLNWGGGVCGAIFRGAGEEYEAECKKIMNKRNNKPIDISEVIITRGFNLKTRYIYHIVGANINRGDDINLVENCYLNCIKKAEENRLSSIAFPAISTGILGLEVVDSAKIVKKLLESYYIKNLKYIKNLCFILYNEDDYNLYKKIIV